MEDSHIIHHMVDAYMDHVRLLKGKTTIAKSNTSTSEHVQTVFQND